MTLQSGATATSVVTGASFRVRIEILACQLSPSSCKIKARSVHANSSYLRYRKNLAYV